VGEERGQSTGRQGGDRGGWRTASRFADPGCNVCGGSGCAVVVVGSAGCEWWGAIDLGERDVEGAGTGRADGGGGDGRGASVDGEGSGFGEDGGDVDSGEGAVARQV